MFEDEDDDQDGQDNALLYHMREHRALLQTLLDGYASENVEPMIERGVQTEHWPELHKLFEETTIQQQELDRCLILAMGGMRPRRPKSGGTEGMGEGAQ